MKRLSRFVQAVYMLRRKMRSEETYLTKILGQRKVPGATLLEVGCGRGRFADIVSAAQVAYVGVDLNLDVIVHNQRQGRQVCSVSEFSSRKETFDFLLFAHILEHFNYKEAVAFLNQYVPLLKPGGTVIIFTPVYHRGFYDDFDHVKPYNPEALRQLFCQSSLQTQRFGLKGTYRLLSLWFKYDPLGHFYRRGKWTHVIKIPLTLLYVVSWGFVGRLTGYGMVLEKEK